MITLITPTKNRPVPFSLLERWIRRQTYKGPLQWIVVNDGVMPYTYRMDQDIVVRKQRPGEGHSLPENLLAALPHVKGQSVFIVEDDDWYAPTFLEESLALLKKGNALVGLKPSRHYNLHTTRFRTFQLEHCNLGSTAFSAELLAEFKTVCRTRSDAGSFGVDTLLWKTAAKKAWRENISNAVQHVGLKGLPGEPGLGMGHKMNYGTLDDPDMPVLRQWIGKADWEVYRQISQGLYNIGD